jgi:hypothetical protein
MPDPLASYASVYDILLASLACCLELRRGCIEGPGWTPDLSLINVPRVGERNKRKAGLGRAPHPCVNLRKPTQDETPEADPAGTQSPLFTF